MTRLRKQVGIAALGLLLGRIYTNIEYVASAQDDVSIVGCWRVAAVFGRALKDDVHVTIGFNHLTAVLDIVLQPNVYFGVQFLHK